jgi:LmbE family N-acetylglucosaminyl deacetylase
MCLQSAHTLMIFEFGCFGTLKQHHDKGDSVCELILTTGELGGDARARKKEARAAAKLIGATVRFGSFPDGNLRDDHVTVGFIESTIREVKADIVYTHSRVDRHQDHRYASFASVAASRFVNEVYEYETPSVIDEFTPKMFVDVTEGMRVKIAALECHVSQRKKQFRDFPAVTGLAKYRAFQAGMHDRMAEAFEVVRVIKWP